MPLIVNGVPPIHCAIAFAGMVSVIGGFLSAELGFGTQLAGDCMALSIGIAEARV